MCFLFVSFKLIKGNDVSPLPSTLTPILVSCITAHLADSYYYHLDNYPIQTFTSRTITSLDNIPSSGGRFF